MKVYRNFPEVVSLLKEQDMLKQAVLVSRAGLDGERVLHDLEAHQDESLNYLSTILTRSREAAQAAGDNDEEA